MKNKKKALKAVSIILVILTVLSVSPSALFKGPVMFSASAASSGKIGDNLSWTLSDNGDGVKFVE